MTLTAGYAATNNLGERYLINPANFFYAAKTFSKIKQLSFI